MIAGQFHPVIDISAGGISFRSPALPVGMMLIAELAEDSRPGLGELVVVRVRNSVAGTVHAEFTSSDACASAHVAADGSAVGHRRAGR